MDNLQTQWNNPDLLDANVDEVAMLHGGQGINENAQNDRHARNKKRD